MPDFDYSAIAKPLGADVPLVKPSRLAHTTGRPDLDPLYEQTGEKYGIDPNLLLEQGRQESINFKPSVVAGRLDSPKGARGVSQFMPDTARQYGLRVGGGIDERTDPAKSIDAQARLMKSLLDRFGGDERAALAAYNSGTNLPREKALRNADRIPETRNYVSTILGRRGAASPAEFDYSQLAQPLGQSPAVPQPPKFVPPALSQPDSPTAVSSMPPARLAPPPIVNVAEKIPVINPPSPVYASRPDVRGMVERGNVDLNDRPVVHNRDGSISTVRSMSTNIDGREVLLPTVSDDGRILTNDQAIGLYKRTGKHLGVFDSPQNATAYAQALHNDQAQQYASQDAGAAKPVVQAVAPTAIRRTTASPRPLHRQVAKPAVQIGAKAGFSEPSPGLLDLESIMPRTAQVLQQPRVARTLRQQAQAAQREPVVQKPDAEELAAQEVAKHLTFNPGDATITPEGQGILNALYSGATSIYTPFEAASRALDEGAQSPSIAGDVARSVSWLLSKVPDGMNPAKQSRIATRALQIAQERQQLPSGVVDKLVQSGAHLAPQLPFISAGVESPLGATGTFAVQGAAARSKEGVRPMLDGAVTGGLQGEMLGASASAPTNIASRIRQGVGQAVGAGGLTAAEIAAQGQPVDARGVIDSALQQGAFGAMTPRGEVQGETVPADRNSMAAADVPVETRTIVRHSNPEIDGDAVVGRTSGGKLKVQGEDGVTHTVKDPRRSGNREAALSREVVSDTAVVAKSADVSGGAAGTRPVSEVGRVEAAQPPATPRPPAALSTVEGVEPAASGQPAPNVRAPRGARQVTEAQNAATLPSEAATIDTQNIPPLRPPVVRPAESAETGDVEVVPKGYTRFYRADRADATEPQGAGWANDSEYVSKKYGAGGQNGTESIWYIDVPSKPFIDDVGYVPAIINNDTLKLHGIDAEPKLYRRVADPATPVEAARLEADAARERIRVAREKATNDSDAIRGERGRAPSNGGATTVRLPQDTAAEAPATRGREGRAAQPAANAGRSATRGNADVRSDVLTPSEAIARPPQLPTKAESDAPPLTPEIVAPLERDYTKLPFDELERIHRERIAALTELRRNRPTVPLESPVAGLKASDLLDPTDYVRGQQRQQIQLRARNDESRALLDDIKRIEEAIDSTPERKALRARMAEDPDSALYDPNASRFHAEVADMILNRYGEDRFGRARAIARSSQNGTEAVNEAQPPARRRPQLSTKAEAKEPWQMGRAEYRKAYYERHKVKPPAQGERLDARQMSDERMAGEGWVVKVAHAIRDGKPVSDAVKAEAESFAPAMLERHSKPDPKAQPARLQVRAKEYRDTQGFGVVGKDSDGRSISIFVKTRETADAVKAAVVKGDSAEVSRLITSEKSPALPNLTTQESAKLTAARQRVKAKLNPNQLHDVTDLASVLPDLAIIGKYHVINGARTFAAFSKEMVDEFGEAVKPHLEKLHGMALEAAGIKESPATETPETPALKPPDTSAAGRTQATPPSLKNRAFPVSAEQAGIAGGEDRSYEGITNKETYKRAQDVIASRGADSVAADLSARSTLSADDTAQAVALMQKYTAEGNHAKAAEVAGDAARKLTEAGQAVQAASMISRLSPEGVLVAAQRQLKGSGKSLSPEQAESLTGAAVKLREAETRINALEAKLEAAKQKVTTPRPKLETLQERLSKLEQEARARLDARKNNPAMASQAGASTIPLDIADYAIIGASKLARKGITFAQWTKEMIDEHGSEIKPKLRAIYKESYATLAAHRKELRAESMKRVATRGRPDLPSDEVNQLVVERQQAQAEARAARVELARQFKALKNPRLDLARRTLDTLNVNALLLPRGFARILMGMGGKQVMDVAGDVVGAGADRARATLTGQPRVTAMPSPAEYARSIGGGVVSGVRNAARALAGKQTDFMDAEQPLSGNAVLDGALNSMTRLYGAKENFLRSPAARLERAKLAKAMAINDARDGLIPRSEVNAQARAYQSAQPPPLGTLNTALVERLAQSQANYEKEMKVLPGLTTQSRAAQFKRDISQLMDSMARRGADEQVYAEPSKIADRVGKATRAAGLPGKIVQRFYLPFMRRPSNSIVDFAQTYVGAPLNIPAQTLRVALKDFSPEASRAFAKSFRGAPAYALMGLGYELAHKGLMRGANDPDEKKRGAVLVNGRWYPIKNIPVVGWLSTLGATMHDSGAKSVPAAAAKMILDHPLLKGVQNMARTVETVGKGDLKRAAQDTAGEAGKRLVPQPLPIIAETSDAKARDTRGHVLQPAMTSIPFVRRAVPAYADKERGSAFDPFYIAPKLPARKKSSGTAPRPPRPSRLRP